MNRMPQCRTALISWDRTEVDSDIYSAKEGVDSDVYWARAEVDNRRNELHLSLFVLDFSPDENSSFDRSFSILERVEDLSEE